jgi:glucan 1,3-beta-glucosidase
MPPLGGAFGVSSNQIFPRIFGYQFRLFAAYMKEGCEDDPGWCFKAAVNNSLPATFFSYGQDSITDPWHIQALATTIANMTAPSTSDILAMPLGIVAAPGAPPTSRREVSPELLYKTPRFHHRFEAIHLRRDWRRNNISAMDQSAGQRSIARGYSDGFLTAKFFASSKLSKLGFVGQYIMDSTTQLGPSVISPGTESNYHDAFIKGLEDGQGIVMSVVNPPS